METRMMRVLVVGSTGFALLERKRLERDGHRVMVARTSDVALVICAYRAGKRDFPMRSTPHISGLPALVSRVLAAQAPIM